MPINELKNHNICDTLLKIANEKGYAVDYPKDLEHDLMYLRVHASIGEKIAWIPSKVGTHIHTLIDEDASPHSARGKILSAKVGASPGDAYLFTVSDFHGTDPIGDMRFLGAVKNEHDASSIYETLRSEAEGQSSAQISIERESESDFVTDGLAYLPIPKDNGSGFISGSIKTSDGERFSYNGHSDDFYVMQDEQAFDRFQGFRDTGSTPASAFKKLVMTAYERDEMIRDFFSAKESPESEEGAGEEASSSPR